jgi:hypothetical protein
LLRLHLLRLPLRELRLRLHLLMEPVNHYAI